MSLICKYGMRKNGWHAPLLILLLTLLLLAPSGSALALFGGKDLVTINGIEFTPEDYRHWWREWREPGMELLKTPDEFIDFMLLSQEASAMQLQDNPNYRNKLQVFLKVRALMQLKSEEIEARKKIPSKDELWKAYKDGYTPILNLRMLTVNDLEQANVVKGFLDKGVSLDKVAEAAGVKDSAEQMAATGPMRYTRIPNSLQSVALKLKPGEVGGPASFGHSWYFIEVLERQEGSEADYESVKQMLIRDSLKRQEYELTYQLVEKLKANYEARVYNDVIEAIQPGGIANELAAKTAVKIGKTEVAARFIYETVTKAQQTRGQAKESAESFAESKQRVVNDLLVQTLTGMEAMARHYENVPPLKHTFEFYSNHRLIKELEATVIQPRVKIADADIETYYKQHPEKYSREGLVKLAVVKTNEYELAEKLSTRLKAGEDFFKVMEPVSPAGIQVDDIAFEHLSPVVQAEITKLSAGQVSSRAKEGDNLLFIKLVHKGERELIPLEKVKAQISDQLKIDRFKEQRAAVVKQLRNRSTIKWNHSTWKKLNKELNEEEARHAF